MTSRVLFLDHVGVLGGAELSLLDIARRYGASGTVALMTDGPFRQKLESAGVRTILLPLGTAAREIQRETVFPRPKTFIDILGASWRVARIARDFDLLYANSQKAFVVATIAGLISRTPVLWHLRDILNHEHFSSTNVRVVVALANHFAARIVANSQATADAFVARGGRRSKVAVVHNGIDMTPFSAVTADDVATMRESLGLGQAHVVGLFGRLSHWKGQHVLLDALPKLPGVHALFVGDAIFGEGAYAESLRQRARDLGVSDRAHFLGFRTDVPTLMRTVDIVVHSSVLAEPFGRVIAEGMMAGKPVIASRSGGTGELVQHNCTGYLTTPGDSDELAEMLSAVLRTDRAAEVARTGRSYALQRFSLETMFAGIASQIEEAILH